MIRVEESTGGIRVVDADKNEASIRIPDWHPGDHATEIDRNLDETLAGSATELWFDDAMVCVESSRPDQWVVFNHQSTTLDLEEDIHLVSIELHVGIYLKFNGSATLYRDLDQKTVGIVFPHPTSVTLGFRSPTRRTEHQLTIPPTEQGVATALSYLSAAHETTKPDRSYPTLRNHPPLITIDDSLSVPSVIRTQTPDTGIRLVVPSSFEHLFVVAPLAYYLQARVTVDPESTPRLTTTKADVDVEFQSIQSLEKSVSELLHRVFYLDCLVRNAGPYGTDLTELSLLNQAGIDAETAYSETPQHRLDLYLSADYNSIRSELPPWHLTTYLDPNISNLTVIPFLLNRLSLIKLPHADRVDQQALVTQALNTHPGDTSFSRYHSTPATTELLLPELDESRVHGWLADGIPLDAFKLLPSAYENQAKYLNRGSSPIVITVVLNDSEMVREQSRVADIYRRRATELDLEVEIKNHLTQDELRAIFEQPSDFMHFIGHCNEAGLECADGYLPVTTLEESNVETFFLNACSSVREGIELIRSGSVAGGVTLHNVIDDHATKVGTAFAQLVVHGFSIEQALRYAGLQTLLDKHYIVVGDGTHTLSQGTDRYPSVLWVTENEDESLTVTTETFATHTIGGAYSPVLADNPSTTLFGNKTSFEIQKSELAEQLPTMNIPVLFNGTYYWSGDLQHELAP